jgi:hypothetical protein
MHYHEISEQTVNVLLTSTTINVWYILMQPFTEQLARDRQHAQELAQNREETLKLSKLLLDSKLAAKVHL